ncbi:MAG: pyridoxal 5'-phosphate synthase glutaminase subunit PdxT [Tannerellaceae bacterium]|jgi:5'-phosphate synthase pdxT subunit|nr:pyridoxal 5'-phosphate synthase glutaminase subunit PdxT [Tannerellaceae bacterium]
MRIGVLALQGGFAEHIRMLRSLQADTFEIRRREDALGRMDGLVLPGGESTAIGKLLKDLGLFGPLKERIRGGLPTFGTCAGMILLARRISGTDTAYFGAIDIEVKRNAFGRQLGSFFTEAPFKGIGTVPMTFIRAPYIERAAPEVEILSLADGHPVAARQRHVLATACHPELTADSRIHRYFIEQLCAAGAGRRDCLTL